MQYNIQLDQDIIGVSFSKFDDGDFIEIDSNTCLNYGVSYKFNKYHDNEELKFEFLDMPLMKIALRVKDERIFDTYLLLEVQDIDEFYYKVYDVYGAAQQGRISNDYFDLNRASENLELNLQKQHLNLFDLIPKDFSEYKYFRSLTWFEIETVLSNTIETSLHISHKVLEKGTAHQNYEVAIRFKVTNLEEVKPD